MIMIIYWVQTAYMLIFPSVLLDIVLANSMAVLKWACRVCHKAYRDRLSCSVIVRIPA